MGETVQVPLIVTSDVLHNGTLYGPGREAGDRLVVGEAEADGLVQCGVAQHDAEAETVGSTAVTSKPATKPAAKTARKKG